MLETWAKMLLPTPSMNISPAVTWRTRWLRDAYSEEASSDGIDWLDNVLRLLAPLLVSLFVSGNCAIPARTRSGTQTAKMECLAMWKQKSPYQVLWDNEVLDE